MFNAEKIRNLIQNSNYSIFQANGQRIYGLRNSAGISDPPKGTELFIGKLPRQMCEDELVPLLSQPAPIYQLRLMVDYAGQNRGYCFVRYFSLEDADLALRTLDNMEVRPGCKIGVFKSVDNTKLFVGGIPALVTRFELQEFLEAFMDDIKDIEMYPMSYDSHQNRGYAFVEFENHRAAAIARRRLPSGPLLLWGHPIKIDWADPLPDPDPEIMAKVTTLFMRNLPIYCSVEALRESIYEHVDPENIEKISKSRNFGFLQFVSRSAAEQGMTALQNWMLRGQLIDVTWARPRMYSKGHHQRCAPSHFCLSLPFKQRWAVKQKTQSTRFHVDTDAFGDCGRRNGSYYSPTSTHDSDWW